MCEFFEWAWNGPGGAGMALEGRCERSSASKPACMSCDGVRRGLVVMVGAGLLAIARSAPTAFARSAPPGLARCAPLRGLLAAHPSRACSPRTPPGLARRAAPGLPRHSGACSLCAAPGLARCAPLQGFHGTPGGPALFVAYKEALSFWERAPSFEQKVVMRGVVRYPPFYNTTKLKSQSVRGVGISLLEAYMIANCLSILVRTILLELNY